MPPDSAACERSAASRRTSPSESGPRSTMSPVTTRAVRGGAVQVPSTASPASASRRSTAPSWPWRSVPAQTSKSSGMVIGGTCGAAMRPEASTVPGRHRLSILPANGWVHGSRRLSAARPSRRPVTRVTRHLGLDLGGTNTKWAVVEHDGDDWRTLATGQGPTPAAEGPDAVVGSLASMGSEVMDQVPGVESVGIGVPGLYDPATGETRFLVNVPGAWAGKPVGSPVGASLGRPTALINDARAFGLAELRLGAGRGASTMIGLTLGTGVGGVIAINGQIHQGHDGTAGEIGHQTIDPDGPWCGCGNRGCVEAYARADQITAACGTATPED